MVADSQSTDVIGNGTLPRRWPSIERTLRLDQCHVFPGSVVHVERSRDVTNLDIVCVIGQGRLYLVQ